MLSEIGIKVVNTAVQKFFNLNKGFDRFSFVTQVINMPTRELEVTTRDYSDFTLYDFLLSQIIDEYEFDDLKRVIMKHGHPKENWSTTRIVNFMRLSDFDYSRELESFFCPIIRMYFKGISDQRYKTVFFETIRNLNRGPKPAHQLSRIFQFAEEYSHTDVLQVLKIKYPEYTL